MRDDFFLCYFETTRRCNLTCRYCMSRPETAPAGTELSTEEAKTLVLDELAKVSTHTAVAFSGGEHLLRPDAFELLAHAAKVGLWSFVNTNGKILVETDAVREALRATDGRLIFVLPINSIEEKVNRESRDADLAMVMEAAEICRREGAEYFFILTISKENLLTLEKTITFLKRNQVPMLRAPFVPRGAGCRFSELFVDRDDMQAVIHPALSANPLAYISFTPFFISPERMNEIEKSQLLNIQGFGCQAGRAFAAVGAEGDVVPCVQLLDSACVRGNVRDLSLAKLLSEDSV
ncbi:MAG: radical SAM protein, partial [Planctomycetota bacterium]